MDYFKALKIEPTTDKSAIKRAYNREWGVVLGDYEKTKVLNEAYDLALRYADNDHTTAQSVASAFVEENNSSPSVARAQWPHYEKSEEKVSMKKVCDNEINVTKPFEKIKNMSNVGENLTNGKEIFSIEEHLKNKDENSNTILNETRPREVKVFHDEKINTTMPHRKRQFHPLYLISVGVALIIFFIIRANFENTHQQQQYFEGFPIVISEPQPVNPNLLSEEALEELIDDLLEEWGVLITHDETFNTLYDTVWELLVDVEIALINTNLWRENEAIAIEVETQALWILDALVDYGHDISTEFLEYLYSDLKYLYEMLNQVDE